MPNEQIIDGILHYELHGEMIPYSQQELTRMLIEGCTSKERNELHKLLTKAREVAEWHVNDGDECGILARIVMADIDAFEQIQATIPNVKRFPKPSKEILEIVLKWLEPKILPLCDEPPKVIQALPLVPFIGSAGCDEE